MKVFYNNKGKVAGWLKDQVYYKTVDSRKHFMKIYSAYGIDLKIVEDIMKECNKIRLREIDTKRIYEVDWLTFGLNAFKKNWGDGEQMFLPLKHWKLEDATIKLF